MIEKRNYKTMRIARPEGDIDVRLPAWWDPNKGKIEIQKDPMRTWALGVIYLRQPGQFTHYYNERTQRWTILK